MMTTKWWRRIGLFLLAVLLCWGFAACERVQMTPPAPAPVPVVSPLPNPQLPDWIEEISPQGTAKGFAQIRIRFKEPLIPLENLDSPSQDKLLDKFTVLPPLPGRFVFLTPRMVGFQAEQAIPRGSRVQVTLKSGLKDLKNHQLTQDLAWTFVSEPIAFSNLPGKPIMPKPANPDEYYDDQALDLKPNLSIVANAELDLSTLKQHTRFVPQGGQDKPTGVEVALAKEQRLDEPFESPQERFNPGQKRWVYTVTPTKELARSTTYRLEINPGVRSISGNLPSETAFVSEIKTYAALAFEKLERIGQPDSGGSYGRFSNGVAQLRFSNGLNLESAQKHIKISPAPLPDLPALRVYEGSRQVTLNPYALEPAKTYTITIDADLEDQYQQKLGKPLSISYETGDVAPSLWAPQGLHIFPVSKVGKDLQLEMSVVNLPQPTYQAAYRVVQPTDLVYFSSAYPSEQGGLLPAESFWQSFSLPQTMVKNQTNTLAINLQQQLGKRTGMLAYGVKARTYQYTEENQTKWREPGYYGLVQVTNLGVFSQWFPQSGLVRVNHLDDGSPVNNATIEVYQSQLEAKSRPQPTACATGRTDARGLWLATANDLQGCLAGKSAFDSGPELLVVAKENQDWAFARNREYGGAYGYGVDAGWQGSQPIARGLVFSDRNLYQPGEKIALTGVAYYLQDGVLQQDRRARYKVILEGPDGQKTEVGNPTTTNYGTFSLEFTLADNQPLGFYKVQAKGDSGTELFGEFRVAEFKPPNFKVSLKLEGAISPGQQPFVLPEQSVIAKAEGRYLFGAPVERGQAAYYVTRDRREFTPPGHESFSFGPQWFWPAKPPELPAEVLKSQLVLDQQGQISQKVLVAKDLPYPMTYRVDVEVADVSNLTVAASQEFLALPSDRLIGLKTDFVADAGKAFPVQVIVTNPAGQLLPNQDVQLELQQMDYSKATRVIEGSEAAENQVEYKTVATANVRSSDQPQTVNLTAPNAGSYRIRANLAGSNRVATATDTQIWVSGGEPVRWGWRDQSRLEIKLDKETYQIGETATALIQSPYTEGELYFAVVRHKVLYQSITPVKGSAPRIQFQVTPEMLPNAAVEAVLVRQGEKIDQVAPESLDSLSRIGFAPFQTSLAQQTLNIETQLTPNLKPGERQTVQFQLKDAQKRPVSGQLTVIVANEAVLQLTGYRPPNLMETVYAPQPIAVRFSDNRPDVVLNPLASPLEKGWGYGGGFSAGSGSTRLRTQFLPLAYYNGSVLTDAQGRAQVSFTVPDNLTTWRVMAIAVAGAVPPVKPATAPALATSPVALPIVPAANPTNDWKFGNADATFITSLPLMANPVLPQFARPGDRLMAGVALTNTTNQGGTVALTANLEGPLQFADNQQQKVNTQVNTEANGSRAQLFSIVVNPSNVNPSNGPTKASLSFSSQFNGLNDAFAMALPIRPLEVVEQVVEAGATQDRVQIPLQIDSQVANETGGLEISLAGDLIPNLVAPVRQLLDEQDLPFLEPAVSQLAIANSLTMLGRRYPSIVEEFNVTANARSGLERLKSLQRRDGGFASYPSQSEADPFGTAYAATVLGRLTQSGGLLAAEADPNSPLANLSPDYSQMTSRLLPYLKKVLANPGDLPYCKEKTCYTPLRLQILTALAELGETRNDFLADIVAQKAQLDYSDQVRLARFLLRFPDWQTQANQLFEELQAEINQQGRSARVTLPQRWRWLGSSAVAQAEMLRLLVARKAPPEITARVLQGLVDMRRQGVWSGTYENATALSALVEYGRQQTSAPNLEAKVTLGNQSLLTAKLASDRQPRISQVIPIANLPRGNQTLTLEKSGQGLLHYVVAYRYRLQGNPPGRMNGLRVVREIRPANTDRRLGRLGMFAPDPLQVRAGQVYDIGIQIITDHPVDHVMITDPLPAGFEAVDASFQTNTRYFQARGDDWELAYQTIYHDRVVAYADALKPGVYSLHYLVRSVTAGTFLWPGAEAHLQYAPEEFGRCAASTVTIAAP